MTDTRSIDSREGKQIRFQAWPGRQHVRPGVGYGIRVPVPAGASSARAVLAAFLPEVAAQQPVTVAVAAIERAYVATGQQADFVNPTHYGSGHPPPPCGFAAAPC